MARQKANTSAVDVLHGQELLSWRVEWLFPVAQPPVSIVSERVSQAAVIKDVLSEFLNPAPVRWTGPLPLTSAPEACPHCTLPLTRALFCDVVLPCV
jgi:hypothetical protein